MTTPKRRGRPPLDPADRSVQVSVKLPTREFDALYERAQRARVSMPEMIRREMRKAEKDRSSQ